VILTKTLTHAVVAVPSIWWNLIFIHFCTISPMDNTPSRGVIPWKFYADINYFSFPRSAWECRIDALRRAWRDMERRSVLGICITTRSVGTRELLGPISPVRLGHAVYRQCQGLLYAHNFLSSLPPPIYHLQLNVFVSER